MAGSWHLARSLSALFRELRERYPNRDTESDGTIGDASHSARESDHNPDYDAPGDRRGVVRAGDFDTDGMGAGGVGRFLAELKRECQRDNPRVAYVIYQRRIMRSYPKTIGNRTYQPGEWTEYDGPNPHEGHVHVSINHTAAAENDVSSWFLLEVDEVTEAQAARIIDLLEELTAQGRTMQVRMDSITNKQLPALRADVDREADKVAGEDEGLQP